MILRNLIRKCIVTLVGKDSKDVRVQQVSYNGGARDAEIYAPYGMSYNLPVGSVGLYVQIGGDSGNLVMLPDRSQDRVKDLKEGEVAFFNPLTQTRTIYRKNGDIETTINGNEEVVINGNKEVTITGNMNVTINGDCNLKASTVNVDASTTNLGVGGQQIARLGDQVQVVVSSGSSAGTHLGTIISGGVNTSI